MCTCMQKLKSTSCHVAQIGGLFKPHCSDMMEVEAEFEGASDVASLIQFLSEGTVYILQYCRLWFDW